MKPTVCEGETLLNPLIFLFLTRKYIQKQRSFMLNGRVPEPSPFFSLVRS